MASRSTIHQITTMALIEGFFTIMWEQKYKAQPNNKTYAGLYVDLCYATTAAIVRLREECGGLTARELAKLNLKILKLKTTTFNGRPIDAMEVISMAVDLLNSILNRLPEGSPKHALTLAVWYRVRAFERYFDRHKTYDDPAGLIAADTYTRIMAE